eukprot:332811_1
MSVSASIQTFLDEYIKKYDSKLTKYASPCPSNILTHWSNIELNQYFKPFKELKCTCPHHLYKTEESFVDHILWTLHPKTHHSSLTQQLFIHLDKIAICINCMVILLSKSHFLELINLYCVWYKHMHIFVLDDNYLRRVCISKLIHWNIFRHPKMYKIISKSCNLDKPTYLKGKKLIQSNPNIDMVYVHDFGYLCQTMLFPFCSKLFQTKQNKCLHYLGTFFLWIKYWNQYQILFFLSNFRSQLFQTLDCMEKKHGLTEMDENQQIQYLSRIDATETWLILTMRMIMMEIGNRIHLDRNKNALLFQPSQIPYKYRCAIKSQMSHKCSWIECNKLQMAGKNICSGCKMVYYCSKRCQKKSWNKQHRYHCKKLSQ